MKRKTKASIQRTDLHGSVTQRSQHVRFWREFADFSEPMDSCRRKIEACVHWDDPLNNGYNSLRISAVIYRKARNGRWVEHVGNVSMPEIVRWLPQLQPLQKWWMGDAVAPQGYFDAVYCAGDRLLGGKKPGDPELTDYYVRFSHGGSILESALCTFVNGWPIIRKFPTKREANHAAKKCDGIVIAHVAKRYNGKVRDLEAARRLAHWPDAKDRTLTQYPKRLRRRLEQRLPAVMAEFRKDIEALGLKW